MTKYAYSFDEELFSSDYESPEAAQAEASVYAPEGQEVMWIGVQKPAEEFLRGRNPEWVGEHIFKDAELFLADNIGFDDSIIELEPAQITELGKLVTDWLCENAKFNAWGVVDVKEYPVLPEDAA